MQLTNTFKDELTSSLKQYTLCNAIDSSISLLHRMIFTKEESFANVLHFIHFMWLYTLSSFHNRYLNKQ